MTAEYFSGVEGFQADEGGSSYYVGQDNTLLGNPAGFAIAALIMAKIPFAGGGAQTVFANTDAGGGGWALTFDPSSGEITFTVATDNVPGSVTLGPSVVGDGGGTSFTNVPILVLAAFDVDSDAISMAVNVAGPPQVSQALNGTTYVPAAGTAPTVGVVNSAAPTVPAPDVRILGVAYTENLAGVLLPQLDFYLSCREAGKLANPFETDPSLGDFDNRWTAQDGNFQPDGDPQTPLRGQEVWTPSAGALNLTRVGSPTIRGFKNLDWQHSWVESSSVDPGGE